MTIMISNKNDQDFYAEPDRTLAPGGALIETKEGRDGTTYNIMRCGSAEAVSPYIAGLADAFRLGWGESPWNEGTVCVHCINLYNELPFDPEHKWAYSEHVDTCPSNGEHGQTQAFWSDERTRAYILELSQHDNFEAEILINNLTGKVESWMISYTRKLNEIFPDISFYDGVQDVTKSLCLYVDNGGVREEASHVGQQVSRGSMGLSAKFVALRYASEYLDGRMKRAGVRLAVLRTHEKAGFVHTTLQNRLRFTRTSPWITSRKDPDRIFFVRTESGNNISVGYNTDFCSDIQLDY